VDEDYTGSPAVELAMLRRALVILSATFALGTPLPALAHDYWLEPARFVVRRGDAVDVGLFVGDGFVADTERPLQIDKTKSLRLVTREREVDLLANATEGARPVVDDLVLDAAGPVLFAMERKWVDIHLPDEKFTAYLEHEGLKEVAARRDREGHREIERECYTRAVKALVAVDAKRAEGLHDRVLGHKIEILLLDDPFALDVGDRLRAELRFRGKPLARVNITAYVREPGGEVTSRRVRTDARGRAGFPVERVGVWALRTVHLVPCAGCGYADWESYWTSFTFAID